ncbi:Cytochrome c, mono-and diheme variants [Devosia enhydra]|uniref:Cytochrome c, mono-and diheme variants n=1 Tax=Devosia enhydra TaxID=665118 RepID=A0A1K2I2D3_9HYPH|nr:cytochrome c [Devosia enhydra]SFZ86379.1 Cytochrome c, mono-and diheme variants [Devosia enhydra]
MTLKRIALVLVVLVVVAAGGALAYAMRFPAIAPITPPVATAFDAGLVERGEVLAGLGNCGVCHTREGGGEYAGGLPLPTPFGTIYTTNITPDPETGIGTWSEEAFIRAMKHGVDNNGSYLYPAFPYDYYTRVTEDDLKAIYAYLMTREPVREPAKPNDMPFPFNNRILMAGWNLLFLKEGEFQPDPNQSDDWNRGAYIVEGLGHCGACHSPRNMFGAAVKSGPEAYGGGYAEGWYAPPLNAQSISVAPWTEIAFVNYLIDGYDGDHGIAAGPMTPVVNDLYEQSEDDVFAIASYLMTLRGETREESEIEDQVAEIRATAEALDWNHPDAPARPTDPVLARGAQVFESQCAECHRQNGQPMPLALSSVVNAPDASNLVNIVFYGIQPPPVGALGRSMPGRAIQITDEQMADLAAFVRDRFSDRPAWEKVGDTIAAARAAGTH